MSKISVSRGRRGQIKIDSKTLYQSETVLNQLDAAVKIATRAGIISREGRMNEISEKAVEAAHAAYWSTDDGPSGNDRPAMRVALTAALPHLMGEVVAWPSMAKHVGGGDWQARTAVCTHTMSEAQAQVWNACLASCKRSVSMTLPTVTRLRQPAAAPGPKEGE